MKSGNEVLLPEIKTKQALFDESLRHWLMILVAKLKWNSLWNCLKTLCPQWIGTEWGVLKKREYECWRNGETEAFLKFWEKRNRNWLKGSHVIDQSKKWKQKS